MKLFTLLGFTLLAATQGLPAAETRRPPNIIFAIADDMGHASAYGTKWVRTPNFDRLAAQGILFLNAYTPNAKCAPSRASILTGRNPWQNEEAGNHQPFYPVKFKSWMEALGDGGYVIGYTGKGWSPGFMPPERANITGKHWEARTLKAPATGMSNNDYAANFVDFLGTVAKDQPFCFWYGGREPHRPYEYGSGVAKGGYKLTDIDRVPAYWPDNEAVRNDMLDYAFEVAHFDTHLGRIITLLKEKGLLENTIIIATSDNGPPFPRMKGHPFEEAVHLPLAVMWPQGIAAPGRRSDALVSFIDFAPTLLELAGVSGEKNGMQPVTGRSFTDILANQPSRVNRSTLIMGRERNDARARVGTEPGLGYPVRAIREGNFLYLHNFEPDRWPCGDPDLGLKDTDASPTKTAILKSPETGPSWQFSFGKRPADELYNLAVDPECTTNLATHAEHQTKMLALRDNLFAQLKSQNDPRMLGHGDVFDNYPTAAPLKKPGKANND